jgi:uncharacterized membrane protein YdbT with pleckstrin-like domain
MLSMIWFVVQTDNVALGVFVILFGGFFCFLPSLFGFLLAVQALLVRASTAYTITDEIVSKRIRSLILGVSTSEVRIKDIRNVQMRQSVLQSMFGIGDVLVSSAGPTGIVIFSGVTDPEDVARTLRNLSQDE